MWRLIKSEKITAWIAFLLSVFTIYQQYAFEQPNVELKVKNIWKIPWTFTPFNTNIPEYYTSFIFYVQITNTGGTPIALENFNAEILKNGKYQSLYYLEDTDSFLLGTLNIMFQKGIDSLVANRIDKFNYLEVGQSKSGFYFSISMDYSDGIKFTQAVKIICYDKTGKKHEFITDLTNKNNYLPTEEIERQSGVVFNEKIIQHVQTN